MFVPLLITNNPEFLIRALSTAPAEKIKSPDTPSHLIDVSAAPPPVVKIEPSPIYVWDVPSVIATCPLPDVTVPVNEGDATGARVDRST